MPPQPATPQERPHQQHQQQQQQQEEDGSPPQQQQQQTPVKRRGRPPGVKKKATLAKAGTAGPLMAFVLQDVAAKLQELAAACSCSLIVLAASGALATATLQQCSEADPGDTACVGVALSGTFTILSICGCILQPAALPPEEVSTQQQSATPPAAAAASPQHSLSASLANASGGVVGGVVAGPLVAAAPVRLVLGLFGQPA